MNGWKRHPKRRTKYVYSVAAATAAAASESSTVNVNAWMNRAEVFFLRFAFLILSPFFSTLFSFRFSLYAFSLSVRSHFYFTISMLFAPIAILAIVVVTFFSALSHTQIHTLSVVSFPIHFHGFFFIGNAIFFCQQFFLHLFCVSSLTPFRARIHCELLSGCEESVVWCKHNLSHYPKCFFFCSFSSFHFISLVCFFSGCSRCGCDLPFTSACITKRL